MTGTLSMPTDDCPKKTLPDQPYAPDTDDKRNVFVAGLLPSIGDEDLYFIFRSYGPICLSEVLRDSRTGLSRCLGFVEFESPDGAARAIAETNRQQITVTLPSSPPSPDGSTTSVAPHKPSPSTTLVLTLRTRFAARYSPPLRNAGSGTDAACSTTVTASQLQLLMPPTITNKLFIRRVPLFATPETLTKHFSQFGRVTACTIHRDASRRRLMEGGTGEWNMAYVVFSSTKEAAAAARVEHANIPLGVHDEVHFGPLLVKLAETLEQRRVRQLATSPHRRNSGHALQPKHCEHLTAATECSSNLDNSFARVAAPPELPAAQSSVSSLRGEVDALAIAHAAPTAFVLVPPLYADGPQCPAAYRGTPATPRVAMRSDFVHQNVDLFNGQYCGIPLPLPVQAFFVNTASYLPTSMAMLTTPQPSVSLDSSRSTYRMSIETSACGWTLSTPDEISPPCYYVVTVPCGGICPA